MRASALRKLAAAAVALAVVLPGTAQPAQADPDGPNPSLIEFVDLALDLAGRLGSGGGLSPEAIAGMTQDIINALNNAESAVIAHVDSIAAADLRGAARHHLLEFDDINNFEEETLEDWAQSVSGAASLANEYLNTVSDRRAVDDIGYAAITLYGLALVARAKAGFGTTRLRQDYQTALLKIINRLAPSCRYHYPEPNAVPMIRAYTCEVYGAHTATQLEQYHLGVWQLGPIDPAAVEAASYANTSRRVAVEVLSTLP
ncbi:hypothetical protein [Plantactinospora sp. B5E13]|uniref:hypothetical protein n=1 Tax=unclassified Plantactinospora TaxID=2631981 RepID=UPI00325EC530